MSYFGLGGRPPRLPFSRAAAAFASDVTLPPFRPSVTAAGFLCGIGDLLHAVEAHLARITDPRDVSIAAVLERERRTAGNLPQALDGVGHGRFAVNEVATWRRVLFHGLTIPNRLGYVNRAKWA